MADNIVFKTKVEVEGADDTKRLAEGIKDADKEWKSAEKNMGEFEERARRAGTASKQAGKDAAAGADGVKKVGVEADKTGAKLTTLGSRFRQTAGNFLAFAGIDASVRGAFQLVRSGIDTIGTFEQEVAALSSITGATGGDLDFLKDKAKEVAEVSTVSAVDAVKAFKAIGSARPDLLQNKEALASVTQEAIALAEAAQIELAPAGAAVAAAMNQFGLGAGEASRIVNTLAAGSLKGAAEVEDLTEGINKVGTVLARNNVTFEESVGLLETLAEKELKGAVAGRQLRGVVLKLVEDGKGFVNGQFDIAAALEQTQAELNAIADPAERSAEMVKRFGLENVTAAGILTDNIDQFQRLTAEVTNTTTAYTQQATNTDTLNSALKRLSNAWQGVILGFENGGGTLKRVVTFLADNLRTVLRVIVLVATAILSYVSAARVATIATAAWRAGVVAARLAFFALTGQITKAKGVMEAFNVVVKRNPIGFIASAIITAVTAFGLFNDSLEETGEKLDDVNPKVDTLIDRLNRAQDITDKFNANKGTVSIEELRDAVGALREELDGLSDDAADIPKILADARVPLPADIVGAGVSNVQVDENGEITATIDRAAAKAAQNSVENRKRIVEAYRKFLTGEIARLEQELEKRDKETQVKAPDAVVPGTIAALEKEQKALQKKLTELLRIGSPEFFKVRDQFIEVTKQLAEAMDQLKVPDEGPAAGSIAFFEKEVARLREALSKLPEDAEGIDAIQAALFKAEDALERLKKKLLERPQREGSKKELLDDLAEEERHALAIADLDNKAAVTRAKAAGASEEELKRIEEEGKKTRLKLEIDFALRRLEVLKASGEANEAEITAQQNKLNELRAELSLPPDTDETEQAIEDLVDNVVSASEQIADAAFTAWSAWSEASEEALQAQLDQQAQRVAEARRLAEEGNTILLEEEKKKLAELSKERRKAAQRNIAIAQAEAAANAVVAIARAAAEGGGWLSAVTIAATLVALAAGIVQARQTAADGIPSFYGGGRAKWSELGGYTGAGDPRAPTQSLGPKPYQYEREEYVMPHDVTTIPGNRRWFERIHRGRVNMDQMMSKQAFVVISKGGTDEKQVDRIVDAINRQPKTNVRFDRDGVAVMVKGRLKHKERLNTLRK